MRISVIVPVYNTEEYVGRCIESVVSQTYSDWELILVDDGSTDGSLAIIEGYADSDNRIHAFHQLNAGPGRARNKGIEKASGEYIVFVDSDDVISSDYFEKLSKETADVVFIDVDQVDENFKTLHQERMSQYKTLDKDSFLRRQMTGRILWGGVRKAVKRELLINNQIKFTDHHIGEEAIYSFLLLYYAKSVSFINGSVYKYVNREGSQSAIKDDDPWGSVATALKSKTVDLNIYNYYANTINAFLLSSTVVSLDRLARSNDYHNYLTKAKKRIEKYIYETDRKYGIDFNSLNRKAVLSYPLVKYNIPSIFYFISKIHALIRN